MYTFEPHHQPGLYWTTKEKDHIRQELRIVGEATLPSVPNYQCFSDSPSVFDDKVIVLAREGGSTGRIVGFVSCVLLPIDGFDTIIHTGLTCVLPEKQRQGLQSRLHTSLHKLLCTVYPQGIWFTSVSSSISSLVGISLKTANVFPSPDVAQAQETHQRIAKDISLRHRAALNIDDDVMFDCDRFVFYSSPDSLWYRDPKDKGHHHRNVAYNNYYMTLLSQVPGSEVLQVGFMDPALYVKVGNTSKKIGHASTAHSILAYITGFQALLSKSRSMFPSVDGFWQGLRGLRTWYYMRQR
ncbi:hypothetical protein P153DRAFT_392013 [Dothidotthia symphoricarpi CBS 119687]|uniref:Uncharacterized protein n=1 Tax=Dothidotthia symphoricarpi CBS 119687 TaxID=1392245 RepID=A0A6A6ARY0_9PLEO|nr:uncharacterized protein P153DRAFT_392013 [Dothidotthia symphoricarpi CBS 119687]KAF2134689.1 hypothetical protein P153DRAFT_392013 [Dothidotthia symphoricarpi CBS 119687]